MGRPGLGAVPQEPVASGQLLPLLTSQGSHSLPRVPVRQGMLGRCGLWGHRGPVSGLMVEFRCERSQATWLWEPRPRGWVWWHIRALMLLL